MARDPRAVRRNDMSKIDTLLESLERDKCVCILVHNNPDPDALASAAGMDTLPVPVQTSSRCWSGCRSR